MASSCPPGISIPHGNDAGEGTISPTFLVDLGVLYRLIRSLVRLGLRAFFRDIEVRGAENLPPDGPCIVAANHFNSMIDPFLLVATLYRPLCFIAKAPL